MSNYQLLTGSCPEWVTRGLCARTDPTVFFLDRGNSSDQAKKICAMCEVRQDCLDYALANREPWGIWGGLTGRQRGLVLARMKREQPA